MFEAYLTVLRGCGLPVTPAEWIAFSEALNKGLAGSSLTGFYRLGRSLLVHREKDLDTYDRAFVSYFWELRNRPEIPEELWDWLDPAEEPEAFPEPLLIPGSPEELLDLFEERLTEQKERHEGGTYYIGTRGASPFGNSGENPFGIRVGGESRNHSAVYVAQKRRYRDFREDDTLDTRHMQLALRKLRHLSDNAESREEELDMEATVDATTRRGGLLDIRMKRPRENTLKIAVCMDSGGSMAPYSRLVSHLFRAFQASRHLKHVDCWYFHNCVYDGLFEEPGCTRESRVPTSKVLAGLDRGTRLFLVGDASMSLYELTGRFGNIDYTDANETPGDEWLRQFRRKCPKSCWLNPIPREGWTTSLGATSIRKVGEIFPMFPLSLAGLEEAISEIL